MDESTNAVSGAAQTDGTVIAIFVRHKDSGLMTITLEGSQADAACRSLAGIVHATAPDLSARSLSMASGGQAS